MLCLSLLIFRILNKKVDYQGPIPKTDDIEVHARFKQRRKQYKPERVAMLGRKSNARMTMLRDRVGWRC
jgi:hypothetical protein